MYMYIFFILDSMMFDEVQIVCSSNAPSNSRDAFSNQHFLYFEKSLEMLDLNPQGLSDAKHIFLVPLSSFLRRRDLTHMNFLCSSYP